MKTKEIATGCDLAPPGDGVARPTVATTSMQTPMPMPPTMSSQRRPNRSAVQMALRVKRMPQVALRALIRLLRLVSVVIIP